MSSVALKKLIEAVEAGNDWISVQADAALPPNQAVAACNAYGNGGNPFENGSLDAAKALHDSLLPGWVAHPVIGGEGAGVTKWHCEVEDWDSGDRIDGYNQPNPARAWLLAILKAKLSEDHSNA